ncbi:MAG: hypothetical protein HC798_03745 [Polaribacter sp.]|nr:hypothetical protein [Polaribacter sp.]
MPERWRGRYNEDTDLCLQVLTKGLCTILFNAYMIDKVATMTMKGGNSDELYKGDGRLVMARSLERLWPGIVTVTRRFKRPQHVVRWDRFKQSLKKRTDIVIDFNKDYNLKPVQVAEKIKSKHVQSLVDNYG